MSEHVFPELVLEREPLAAYITCVSAGLVQVHVSPQLLRADKTPPTLLTDKRALTWTQEKI